MSWSCSAGRVGHEPGLVTRSSSRRSGRSRSRRRRARAARPWRAARRRCCRASRATAACGCAGSRIIARTMLSGGSSALIERMLVRWHHDVGDFELVQVEQAAHAVAVLLDHLPVAVQVRRTRRAVRHAPSAACAPRRAARCRASAEAARGTGSASRGQHEHDSDDGPRRGRRPG